MAQGWISGMSSFANIISPLIFSPLTGNSLTKFTKDGTWLVSYSYYEKISQFWKSCDSLLAALFLSDGAPFPFPGFSIMCIGLAWVRLVHSLLVNLKIILHNPLSTWKEIKHTVTILSYVYV